MTNMAGRNDLGKKRVPPQAIPKQSNPTTRFGNSSTNDKSGVKKDIAKKMKKVMQKAGMLEKV